MQKVSDVIRRKHPQFNTIASDSSMYDALHKMFCEHVDYLIVFDNHQKFVGVLTEHDVASKVFFADRPLQHMQVKDFMTTTVPVTHHDVNVEDALHQLENQGSNYLAIYDHITFLGIVNVQDLMHNIISKNKKATQELYH